MSRGVVPRLAPYLCHAPHPGANPCEHAGKCLNTLGSFECQCLQGYTGPRCEIDVNECVSSPCQNDATCLDQIGEFQCICMPGTCSQAPHPFPPWGAGKPHQGSPQLHLPPWPPGLQGTPKGGAGAGWMGWPRGAG